MYYRLKKDMKGFTYDRFLEYLNLRCDIVVVNIPYFDWKKDDEMPKKFDTEYEHFLRDLEEDILDLKEYIISDYYSNEYFTQIKGYMMRILVIQVNSDTLSYLSAANIYDDTFPFTFEDPCFFSKGKCLVYTIAHESVCEIYEDDRDEIKHIKRLGLKLKKVEEDIPKINLNYNLSYRFD